MGAVGGSRGVMGRSAKCANPPCGARSEGYVRSKWHKHVTAANIEAVRARWLASEDASCRKQAARLGEGSRIFSELLA